MITRTSTYIPIMTKCLYKINEEIDSLNYTKESYVSFLHFIESLKLLITGGEYSKLTYKECAKEVYSNIGLYNSDKDLKTINRLVNLRNSLIHRIAEFDSNYEYLNDLMEEIRLELNSVLQSLIKYNDTKVYEVRSVKTKISMDIHQIDKLEDYSE